MKPNILLITMCLMKYICIFSNAERIPLKILHISFHRGCLIDFQEVAKELSLQVTSLYVQDLQSDFDGVSKGNVLYNISKKRAQRVWERHKDYFDSFDMILTSDTAPLSRIFLQNNWTKPLIIWVCNRFDYYDGATSEGDFPDAEYYKLFQKATGMPHVRIVAYTPYEHVYMRKKGIDAGSLVIKPIGSSEQDMRYQNSSLIPHTIAQEKTVFLYPRMDEHQQAWVQQQCSKVGIGTYSGVYNGPIDLQKFKGIIYFPYQWSNVALFENMQHGFVHFVPSQRFIQELVRKQAPVRYVTVTDFSLCEWYMPENNSCIIYFDSWQDLKNKINLDHTFLQQAIRDTGKRHREEMLQRWRALFDELRHFSSDNNSSHD